MVKIYKFVGNYITSLDLFVQSIERILLSIEKSMEQTKTKINDIKNKYKLEKENFFNKYSELEELNKKINIKYFEHEKNILKYVLKMKSLEGKEKSTVENDFNCKLFNEVKNHKEIEKQVGGLGEFGKKFNDDYEKNVEEIKIILNSFFKEFGNQINYISSLYKSSVITPFNDLIRDKNSSNLYSTTSCGK